MESDGGTWWSTLKGGEEDELGWKIFDGFVAGTDTGTDWTSGTVERWRGDEFSVLTGEPNLARLELEIVEGMEKHPDPRCTGVKYLWLLRAMYKGWSLKVLYDKQCCVGIVEEIFQKMPNVQTSWEVRTGISHEARIAMMPRELAESRLHHRL